MPDATTVRDSSNTKETISFVLGAVFGAFLGAIGMWIALSILH